jgi:hypothetical protein
MGAAAIDAAAPGNLHSVMVARRGVAVIAGAPRCNGRTSMKHLPNARAKHAEHEGCGRRRAFVMSECCRPRRPTTQHQAAAAWADGLKMSAYGIRGCFSPISAHRLCVPTRTKLNADCAIATILKGRRRTVLPVFSCLSTLGDRGRGLRVRCVLVRCTTVTMPVLVLCSRSDGSGSCASGSGHRAVAATAWRVVPSPRRRPRPRHHSGTRAGIEPGRARATAAPSPPQIPPQSTPRHVGWPA